ncbi:MAG: hypothetical protein P0S93_02835 [Candidatus Neptunochlamydia sp.]|nr:hypothetical protein [Candidatus Neptunochlamydia sp.]
MLHLAESQIGDLTFKLLEYCKTRYQDFKNNILLLLKQFKFQAAITNPNEKARFFQNLDKKIATQQGTQKTKLYQLQRMRLKNGFNLLFLLLLKIRVFCLAFWMVALNSSTTAQVEQWR